MTAGRVTDGHLHAVGSVGIGFQPLALAFIGDEKQVDGPRVHLRLVAGGDEAGVGGLYGGVRHLFLNFLLQQRYQRLFQMRPVGIECH